MTSGLGASKNDEQPDRLLYDLLCRSQYREFVLLFESAEALPADVCRYMNLLLMLARKGTTKLNIVLFGSHAPWPGQNPLHLSSTYVARALGPSEAAKGGRGRNHRNYEKAARKWPPRAVWQATTLAVLLLIAGLATVKRGTNWFETPHIAEITAKQQLGLIAPVSPPPSPVSGTPPLNDALHHAVAHAAMPPDPPPGPSGSSAPTHDEWPLRAVRRSPPHALILVAQPGDTLLSMYDRLYRGLPMPAFSDVLTMNTEPVWPGALVMFPEPPGGWPSHTIKPRDENTSVARHRP